MAVTAHELEPVQFQATAEYGYWNSGVSSSSLSVISKISNRPNSRSFLLSRVAHTVARQLYFRGSLRHFSKYPPTTLRLSFPINLTSKKTTFWGLKGYLYSRWDVSSDEYPLAQIQDILKRSDKMKTWWWTTIFWPGTTPSCPTSFPRPLKTAALAALNNDF